MKRRGDGKFTILLAEDDPATGILARIHLEKLGLAVDMAHNGQEALEMWRTGAYGVILLDFNMPRLSGLDAARAIREEEKSRGGGERTRIILITAKPLDHLEEQQSLGVVDFMALKPVNYADIFKNLEGFFPEYAGALPQTGASSPGGPEAPLDIKELENSVGANGVADILRLFIGQTEKYLGEMESALSLGDGMRISQLAHKVKGSSAQFTAMALVEPAEFLQKNCAKGEVATAREKLDILHRELAEIKRYAQEKAGV
jgi:CheY-like chemotaxis protein